MINEVFESIYKKSKWLYLIIHFLSALGTFYLVSLFTRMQLDKGLVLSMSVLGSLGSALFTANKINDSKYSK